MPKTIVTTIIWIYSMVKVNFCFSIFFGVFTISPYIRTIGGDAGSGLRFGIVSNL